MSTPDSRFSDSIPASDDRTQPAAATDQIVALASPWRTLGGSTASRRLSPDWLLGLQPRSTAVAYLVLLTVAEILTTLVDPRAGLVLHSALLFVILLHAALAWEQPVHRLLVTLAFAPLIRLLSLSLPLAEFPRVYWYFITSVPLFVAAFLVARLLGFTWDDLGINLRALPIQGLVALSGLAFGYLEYHILQPEALAKAFTWQEIWLPAMILLFSTGFLEELIFRGLMQSTALQVLGRFGLVYVALVFAVLHIGYRSVVDVVFVLVVGLFFGWIVLKTRSIVGVTLAHGLTNIVLFVVMPFVATLG